MKKTSSRILAFAVTIALLASLIVGILPVGAVTFNTPNVSLSSTLISATANYTTNFQTTPFGFLAPAPASVAFPASLAVLAGDNISVDTVTSSGTVTLSVADPAVTINGVPSAVPAGGTIWIGAAGDNIDFSVANTLILGTAVFNYYKNAPSLTTGSVTVQFMSPTVVPAAVRAQIGISNTATAPATFLAFAPVNVNVATREVTVYVPTGMVATSGNIRVVIYGIGNPASPGTYSINVKTSAENSYVTSSTYSVAAAPPPTNISVYNAAGFFLGARSDFATLAASGLMADGVTLKLDPGAYDLTANFTLANNNVSVMPSTGSNADTMITGATWQFIVTGNNVTINNLKFTNAALVAPVTLTLQGNNVTVNNCVITGAVTVNGLLAANVINITNSSLTNLVTDTAGTMKLTNNTFDRTGVNNSGNCVSIAANDATISGNTFKVNQTSGFVPDVAIVTAAAVTGLTINNNTFTATGGWGISDAFGATGKISKNTFTGCEIAIKISAAGTMNIENNTIDNTMTNYASTGVSYGAIEISAVGAFTPVINISGNVVSNSAYYSINIGTTVTVSSIAVTGNSFRTNVKGFNNAGIGTVSAVQNWWGDVTGPKNATANPAGIGDPVSNLPSVTFTPFMTAVPTAGQSVTVAASTVALADFSATSGVTVLGFTAPAVPVTGTIIGTEKLASNPKSVTLPFPVISGGYFDVYTSAASTSIFQIKFYAGGINKDTKVYYWSNLSNSWVLASDQGVSGTSDYAFVNVALTTSSPNVTDFQGTAFALVMGPASTPAPFGIAAPSIGSSQGLTNVSFTWASVAGATSYEFIMDDSSAFSTPFTVDQKSLSLPVYQYTGANLTAGTTYFWRVIAYQGNTVLANSQVGYFTAAAPATVAPPVTVITTSFVPTTVISVPPAVTVTPTVITSTVVTVPPAVTTVFTTQPITITTITAPQATIINPTPTYTTYTLPAAETVPTITPAWIWGVIGIGAILIIVVIVLIVRTRRSV